MWTRHRRVRVPGQPRRGRSALLVWAISIGAVGLLAGGCGCSTTPPPAFAFPVKSSATRYARTHHHYPAADMFAPCGTAVVAPTGAVVEEIETRDRQRQGHRLPPALRAVARLSNRLAEPQGQARPSALPGLVAQGRPKRPGPGDRPHDLPVSRYSSRCVAVGRTGFLNNHQSWAFLRQASQRPVRAKCSSSISKSWVARRSLRRRSITA